MPTWVKVAIAAAGGQYAAGMLSPHIAKFVPASVPASVVGAASTGLAAGGIYLLIGKVG